MKYSCELCGLEVSGASAVVRGALVHGHCRDAYERQLAGLIHACPNCHKSGHMHDPMGRTEKRKVPLAPGEDPICAWNGCWGCRLCREKVKYVDAVVLVTCNLCNGKGWLKAKPEPIAKIVDWKLR